MVKVVVATRWLLLPVAVTVCAPCGMAGMGNRVLALPVPFVVSVPSVCEGRFTVTCTRSRGAKLVSVR